MKYLHFTTEDFIVDEAFIQWVKSPDEASDLFWANWIEENPYKAAYVIEAKAFIEVMYVDAPPLAQKEEDSPLQNTHENMKEEIKSKGLYLPWIGAAAAIGLLIICTLLWFSTEAKENYKTAFQETQSITLPDGSEVVLNANSSFETNEDWTAESNREVWLEGEAFFRVTKTPSIGNPKFIVHTKNMDVEVLGTAFNVNTRSEKTTVVLESGKVQLALRNNNANTVGLIPGEKMVYESEKLERSKVNTKVYTSWTAKKIVLENTPFSYLLEVLENHYGFKVDLINKELLDKKLTGTAPIDDNPEVLLKSIAALFNLDIKKQEGRRITISAK